MSEFKKFKQIPTWSLEDKFEVTGEELYAIQDIFEAYNKALPLLQAFFGRFLEAGLIKIKYEDFDGNEMSKDEVDTMLLDFTNRMKDKINKKEIAPEEL